MIRANRDMPQSSPLPAPQYNYGVFYPNMIRVNKFIDYSLENENIWLISFDGYSFSGVKNNGGYIAI